MNKGELRREMRSQRKNLPDRAQKSAAVCESLLRLPEFSAARCVLFYMAVGSEVNLGAAMDAALRLGKRVCLPVCRSAGRMDAVAYSGPECLAPGAFGICEPRGEVVAPDEIDLVLCPGLAFDLRGGRLGYGKGYYDRYLSKVHAFPAGICYTESIVEKVPVEDCDVPMRALICQAGILRTEV